MKKEGYMDCIENFFRFIRKAQNSRVEGRQGKIDDYVFRECSLLVKLIFAMQYHLVKVLM